MELNSGSYNIHFESAYFSFDHFYDLSENTNLVIGKEPVSTVIFHKPQATSFDHIKKATSYFVQTSFADVFEVEFENDVDTVKKEFKPERNATLQLRAQNFQDIVYIKRLQPFTIFEIKPQFTLTNYTKDLYNKSKNNYATTANYLLLSSEIYLILNQFSVNKKSDGYYADYISATEQVSIDKHYSNYTDSHKAGRLNAGLLVVNSLALVYLHFFSDYTDLFIFKSSVSVDYSYNSGYKLNYSYRF